MSFMQAHCVYWYIAGFGVLGEILYRLYLRHGSTSQQQQNQSSNRQRRNITADGNTTPSHDGDQVLFFPDINFPCPQLTKQMKTNHIVGKRVECSKRGCKFLHGRSNESPSGLLTILKLLASARIKVDLCIFIISFPTLSDLLIDLHRNKVTVRIITDGSEDEAIGSKVEELRDQGIVIKSNVSGQGALMHHKFAIVDDHTVLTGSFNWTKKAIISNYDNVLVTSAANLVDPFVHEFDLMWNRLQHHPRSSSR